MTNSNYNQILSFYTDEPQEFVDLTIVKLEQGMKEKLLAVADFYTDINETFEELKCNNAMLFALYKCMHPKCMDTFSTNDADKMLKHLDSHLKLIDVLDSERKLNKQTRSLQNKCRECCYCGLKLHKNSEVIRHIQEEHANSVFQCKYCFYRAAEIDSLVIHHKKLHPGKPEEILLCIDPMEPLLLDDESKQFMKTSWSNFLEHIQCRQGIHFT